MCTSPGSRIGFEALIRPSAPGGTRLDHALVALDLLGRALGDLLPVIEHGHAIRDPHHHLHIVLDHQDRQVSSLRSFDTKPVKSSVSWEFMPAVGSSRSRSFGSVTGAQATSSRRWSPYGRLRA